MRVPCSESRSVSPGGHLLTPQDTCRRRPPRLRASGPCRALALFASRLQTRPHTRCPLLPLRDAPATFFAFSLSASPRGLSFSPGRKSLGSLQPPAWAASSPRPALATAMLGPRSATQPDAALLHLGRKKPFHPYTPPTFVNSNVFSQIPGTTVHSTVYVRDPAAICPLPFLCPDPLSHPQPTLSKTLQSPVIPAAVPDETARLL